MTQPDPTAHAEAIRAIVGYLSPSQDAAILSAVRALRDEAFEAGALAMREAAAQEASAWFPAGTAAHYPAGGVISAICAINPADLWKDKV